MQSMIQLIHQNNFRFGSARLKLDSAGESDRYESHSEASEEESDAALDWEEDAKSAFFESSESSSHQDQDWDVSRKPFHHVRNRRICRGLTKYGVSVKGGSVMFLAKKTADG